MHYLLPLCHLLWSLSPPFSSSLSTHGKPEAYVWLAGGFVTEGHSEPPSSLSSPRLHLRASSRLAPIFLPWLFTPLTIARPHNSPFVKTPILSLPSGLHRQPGLGCRLSTPKQLFYLCVYAKSLSHVQLFTTLWTIACQAPLSMRFSSKNTGVGCHALLQGIFPTWGLNLGLPHCRRIPYHLSHQGSPITEYSASNRKNS